MHKILLIDDEAVIRTALRRLLERNGYRIEEAGSIQEACTLHDPGSFDLIISDLRLPGEPGVKIIELSRGVPVLIMTSYASVKSAVDAMQKGAADYIAKPFDHDEMLHLISRVLDGSRLRKQNAALKSDLERDYPVAGIIGACPAMKQIFTSIAKVAPTRTSVLILGESGTGKELVARAVHEQSERQGEALVAVNCASIAEGLMESELFGHQRGAFTGAVQSHTGLVESAHGGTLFLDEIGELSLAAQAQLLRVLQDGELRRVGSSRTIRADLRLIAATNRDLKGLVEQGKFRDDLYYRLQVLEIRMPPLRERGKDITALAEFMLDKMATRLGHRNPGFDADAIPAITAYHWPGNVRELENAIERAMILSDSAPVTASQLGLGSPQPRVATIQGQVSGAGTGHTLDDYLVQFVTSNQHHMTETQLARALGISRKSLWERRQRLGIPRNSGRSA